MMRCFVALDLPEGVKDNLYSLQKTLNTKEAKIKWVAKKNLHLTLKFLGDVEDIKYVGPKLKKIKSKKFGVGLGRLGVFPNENFIRVVFVSLYPPEEIIRLQRMMDAELLSLFSKDERFHSHITLGRVKFVKDKKNFLERIKENEIEGNFEVEEFKLYQSTLTKDGPRYKVIETYPLG